MFEAKIGTLVLGAAFADNSHSLHMGMEPTVQRQRCEAAAEDDHDWDGDGADAPVTCRECGVVSA